jgi:hypothetical protein
MLEDFDGDGDAMRWRPQRVTCGTGQPLPVLPWAVYAESGWLSAAATAHAIHAERLSGVGLRLRPADNIAGAATASRGQQTFWWPAHHTTC